MSMFGYDAVDGWVTDKPFPQTISQEMVRSAHRA
jgi:hypothetical protein